MKKEKELKYLKEPKQIKLNKKNYIIIIVPIILIMMLIIAIGLYVFIYSNPSSKLKKYLIEKSYVCNKNSCSQIIEGENHTINFKTGEITINTDEYDYFIGNNITFQNKINNQICTYYKDNYQKLTPIDNSFTKNTACEKNIDIINKTIIYYHEMLTKIDIDVNKLNK